MSLRKTTAFLLSSNALSGIVAVVILGLVGHNLSYIHSRTAQHGQTIIAQNVSVNGTEVQQEYTMAYLPEDLRLGSYWFMLVMAIWVTLGSIFIAILLAHRRSKTLDMYFYHNGEGVPNMPTSAGLMISTAVLNFALSAAATIYSFIEWERSGVLDPSVDTSQSNGRYPAANGAWFTPDAWNCQLEDYIPIESRQNRVDNICNEGTTARSLPIAISLLSLVVLYTTIKKLMAERATRSQPPAITTTRLSGDTLQAGDEEAALHRSGVSSRVRRELQGGHVAEKHSPAAPSPALTRGQPGTSSHVTASEKP